MDNDRLFSALWGKYASEILMQNWDNALEDMNRLKDDIELKALSKKNSFFLNQRKHFD